MAEAAAIRRKPLVGADRPRIAPPVPARSGMADFTKQAAVLGINLYPWQKVAARYLTALGQGDRWLYRHVAIVVARQNGKTRLLVPLIVQRLLAGHRIMHTAQDRDLPRSIHEEVADLLERHYADHLAPNRHGGHAIRFASGQEEIRMRDGGRYRIVAPTRSGARGPSNDLVIIDELREMDTDSFIGAANPTLTASRHPQMVYLSNAGDETSVVLNAIRASRDTDPLLAYLEWSADPTLPAESIDGWLQANPSIGHDPATLESLRDDFRTLTSRGQLSIFETENLCRWVTTMRERLVDEFTWTAGRVEDLGRPSKPVLGVSMDPSGRRASVVMAWQQGAEIALRLVANVSGDPVDIALIGELVRSLSAKHSAPVGYDPVTDAELAKFAPKGRAESIAGAKYANASAQFANAVSAKLLRWEAVSEPITDDLTWTARKPDGEPGHFHAVRAKDDHPITAALAAIRAVWLASGPARPVARVY